MKDLEDGADLMRLYPGTQKGLWLTQAVRIQRATGREASLLQLVSRNTEQECSNPRDYIFGLLGLTGWAYRRLRWPLLLQPNYLKPVSDCMRDATRIMLQEEGNLSALLLWCQVGQSPTWAVHWHRHKYVLLPQRHAWINAAKTSTPSSLDLETCDLDRMAEGSDLNILLLTGHSISLVQSTTPILTVAAECPKSW